MLFRSLDAKKVSAVELAQAFLARVAAHRDLNAFLDVRPEVTLAQARAADERRAKGETGTQMNLFASFGLSQTAGTLGNAYESPLNQEQVTLGLQVPIADWGKTRAQREVAKSNLDLERMNVSQERVNFERNVLLKVQQFDLVRDQVQRALRAYEVSLRRQEMTRNRYYIGKIGIVELNIAVQEQEAARRNYVSALQSFWMAYYDLRRSTLYDFANNRSLVNLPAGY
mgnify:CR=1 FL=1